MTLDALATDPSKASELPSGARRALALQALSVLGALALTEPAPSGHAEDRALSLDEAAEVLGMKRDSLYRKWGKLGIGYKDADGKVKFSYLAVRRYIARRAGRSKSAESA